MEHFKRLFKLKREFMVLIIIVLASSILLNSYLYFETLKTPPEYNTNILIVENIQGFMGSVSIAIDLVSGYSFEHQIMYVAVSHPINISIKIRLWTPYTGTDTKFFSFKVYQRPFNGDYQNTPIAEKNVTVQKHKDAMFVESQCSLIIGRPPEPGIYIYRVTIEQSLEYETEFPLLIEMHRNS
ncbi:MAG: hypothetical protein PVH12_02060 [Candidatus Bathyarchaeota archaeon]|jgi:hypothetical protein